MAQSQNLPPIPPLPGQQPQGTPQPAQPGAPSGGAGGSGPATTKSPNQTAREISEQLREQVREQVIQAGQQAGQGTPVVLVPPPDIGSRDNQIPREVIPLFGITFSMIAVMVIGTPIARAIARAIDRRSDKGQLRPGDLAPQLRQLQESVDTLAIEMERISESQRFTAKLLADRAAALPSGEERR